MAENEDDDVGEKRPALLAGENPTDMGDALQAQGRELAYYTWKDILLFSVYCTVKFSVQAVCTSLALNGEGGGGVHQILQNYVVYDGENAPVYPTMRIPFVRLWM